MKKTFSFATLVAVVLFFVLTISTSKFQTSYHEGDRFGFPLVFFSAANNHEIVTDQAFSIINLLVDFVICLLAVFSVSALFSNATPQKK